MGKYFITGRQGSGKTTVIKRLQEKGFAAYNMDDLPEATKLEDKISGAIIDWPTGKVDWNKYAWNWQADYIQNLLSSNKNVFLGAVVSNQTDFYPLFDKIFALIVDVDTLQRHLSTHEHESHHLPGETERLIAMHESKQERFVNAGAIPILGGRPLDTMIEEILNIAEIS